MVTLEMAIGAMAAVLVSIAGIMGWVGKVIWERVADRLDSIEAKVISLFPQVEADIRQLKESQSELKDEIRRLAEHTSQYSDLKTEVALLKHIVEKELGR